MSLEISPFVSVQDRVHLESLPGVVERLLQQVYDLGTPQISDVRQVGSSVVLKWDGELAGIIPLRTYSAFSVVLGQYTGDESGGLDDWVTRIKKSTQTGVLSALQGQVRFRVDALPSRTRLIDAISSELPWKNDPRDWDVNIARQDSLVLAQVGAMHRSRRHGKLERIPASSNPLIAALLVQLLKPRPDDVILDPFCGAGTLLVEASAAGHMGTLVGGDTSSRALHASRVNLQHAKGTSLLYRGDAAALPFASGSVARVVSNMPFGKRVGSHGDNVTLYPSFLAELARVLPDDGRAVLLTEEKKLLLQSVERTRGMRVVKEVRLASGGLHPTAYVVEHTRTVRNPRRRSKSGAGNSSKRKRHFRKP